MLQECLIRRKKQKKNFNFFKNYKRQKKIRNFFSKKKSWSQMIPNRLIRREMKKKNFFGGSGNRWWRRWSRRRFL